MPEPALNKFVKENVQAGIEGKVNKGFLLFDVANLVTGENKLKSIKNIIRDLVFSIPLIRGLWVTAFLGMAKGVRSLVKDTGSLEQMLKKLQQIQGLRSSFTPLAGGADAAKKKVAELVNFASSKNLSLEDVGEAAKNLQVMTRGAYSSAQALDQVNDVAKSTGNSILGVSGVIGDFSAKLRSGESIADTVEQMRQMGVVSDATASQLDMLQQNGASAAQVFSALTGSFSQFSGGAKDAAGDIENVNAAYEAAQKNLQEKFASPFVESDIQNTKNMTDAMNAIAPVVGRVAGTLSMITQGLSTVKSSILATVAGSDTFRTALEGVIRIGTIVFTAFAAWQSIRLAEWFFRAAGAATGFGQAIKSAAPEFAGPTLDKIGVKLAELAAKAGIGEKAIAALGSAGKIAFGVAGIGLAIGVIGTLIGIGLQVYQSYKQQEEELKKFTKANNETNESMRKQIASVVTLADKHDALTKALQNQKDAQDQLNKAREEDPGLFGSKKKKVDEAQRALEESAKRVQEAQKAPSTLTPTGQQNVQRKAAEQLQKEEADFQNKLQLAPAAAQPKLLQDHAKRLADQAKQGKQSREERAKIEQEQADAENKSATTAGELEQIQSKIAAKEKEVAKFKTESNKTSKLGAAGGRLPAGLTGGIQKEQLDDEKELNALYLKRGELTLQNGAAQENVKRVGEGAAKGTAPQIEAEIRKLQRGLPTIENPTVKAVAERKIEDLQVKAARQRQLEEESGAKAVQSLQEQTQAKQIQREVDLARLKVNTELEIANIKEEGFARAEKEISARLKYLEAERKAEEAKGSDASQEILDRNAAQTAELEHQKRIGAQQKAITIQGVAMQLAQQDADIKHDSGQRRSLKDLSVFTEKFNELLGAGFEVPAAGNIAKQFATNAATLSAQSPAELGLSTVADSLQKIGGGGGSFASGNDTKTLLERQTRLQEQMAEYLETLAESEKEAGVN